MSSTSTACRTSQPWTYSRLESKRRRESFGCLFEARSWPPTFGRRPLLA